MTGICYIVGAGMNNGLDFVVESDDLVIAADGGLDFLEQNDIPANVVIGDFDSASRMPVHENVIVLNREKDNTDTLAAIHEGIGRGYKHFHIFCGTGGRIDHTFANIQAITFLSQKQMKGYLFDGDNAITAVTNGSIVFDSYCSGYISMFSFSDKSSGVNIKGLKYELDDAVLTNNNPIGVSNEFIGIGSTVAVREGTLIVVFPKRHMKGILGEHPR